MTYFETKARAPDLPGGLRHLEARAAGGEDAGGSAAVQGGGFGGGGGSPQGGKVASNHESRRGDVGRPRLLRQYTHLGYLGMYVCTVCLFIIDIYIYVYMRMIDKPRRPFKRWGSGDLRKRQMEIERENFKMHADVEAHTPRRAICLISSL